ncbi:MAG: hydroxymethylbilane synthase [Myxococcota bacterium]
MKPVRIATRRSALALWQARYVAALIEEELGASVELLPLSTSGDRLRGPLAAAGGKGLFVKEIEQALLDGRADVAVHSGKDLPAQLPPELPIVAVPPREDARDALLAARRGTLLADLSQGARVGTGSVRRAAQLLRLRPDLEIVPLRGNVSTRIEKLESESLDAVILACAGLERLALASRIDERISPEQLLPAVAQGSLAIQARRGETLAEELAALGDPPSAARFEAERAFLAELGGDCSAPIAALAEVIDAERLRFQGLVLSPDGRRSAETQSEVPVDRAAEAGREAGLRVLAEGGREILAAAQAEAPG